MGQFRAMASLAFEPAFPRPWPQAGRWWLAMAAALSIGAAWFAGSLAGKQADAALAREAAISARLFEAVLRSALERHRATPMVLASDGTVAAALADPDPAARARLDARLARLASETHAAAIYVIAADGRTIAASNAGTPLSFVGRNFTFRDYFLAAMQRGRGEQFALGTTTNRPGLYLSARVERDGVPMGVVVSKIDFSTVEARWRQSGAPVFVADAGGTVVITSVEGWRFRPIGRLGLGASPGNPAHVLATLPGGRPAEYVRVAIPAASPGWTLNLLRPAKPAVDSAVTAASTLTLLVAMALILAGWLLLRRRTMAARVAAARAAAQAELEARVADPPKVKNGSAPRPPCCACILNWNRPTG